MNPTKKTEKQDKKAYWREIIEAWKASGKTKATFCKERGLAANYLSTWHHRLLREEKVTTPLFIPVKLKKPTVIAKDELLLSEALMIELANGIRVPITARTNKTALRIFLEVVGAVPC
jgi:hypothetical protein